MPTVFPPFERIIEAEDGTVWLHRRIHSGQVSFDVFDANGEFLGPVALPHESGTLSIHSITADHIYAVTRDEWDVQYAVRLRILR